MALALVTGRKGPYFGIYISKGLAVWHFSVTFSQKEKPSSERGMPTQSLKSLPLFWEYALRTQDPRVPYPDSSEPISMALVGGSSPDLVPQRELYNYLCTPGLRSGQRLLFVGYSQRLSMEVGGVHTHRIQSSFFCRRWSQGWKEKVFRGPQVLGQSHFGTEFQEVQES